MIFGTSVLHDASALSRTPENTPDVVVTEASIKDGESTHTISARLVLEGLTVGVLDSRLVDEGAVLVIEKLFVVPEMRRQKLAQAMVSSVLARTCCDSVVALRCRLSQADDSSWSFWLSMAGQWRAQMQGLGTDDERDTSVQSLVSIAPVRRDQAQAGVSTTLADPTTPSSSKRGSRNGRARTEPHTFPLSPRADRARG